MIPSLSRKREQEGPDRRVAESGRKAGVFTTIRMGRIGSMAGERKEKTQSMKVLMFERLSGGMDVPLPPKVGAMTPTPTACVVRRRN